MRCTLFTCSSAKHLVMAIQDAPANIHNVCRSSLFVYVHSDCVHCHKYLP